MARCSIFLPFVHLFFFSLRFRPLPPDGTLKKLVCNNDVWERLLTRRRRRAAGQRQGSSAMLLQKAIRLCKSRENRPALYVIKFKLRPDVCTEMYTLCLFAYFFFFFFSPAFLSLFFFLPNLPRLLSLALFTRKNPGVLSREYYATDVPETGAGKYGFALRDEYLFLKGLTIFFKRAPLAVIMEKVYANASRSKSRVFRVAERFEFHKVGLLAGPTEFRLFERYFTVLFA